LDKPSNVGLGKVTALNNGENQLDNVYKQLGICMPFGDYLITIYGDGLVPMNHPKASERSKKTSSDFVRISTHLASKMWPMKSEDSTVLKPCKSKL
jgi:ArsR family metal-binding transcriptional regulator